VDFFSLDGHKKRAFRYRKWTFSTLTGTKEGFLLPQVDFFSLNGHKKGFLWF
jgi:hypothetical protein